MLVAPFSIKSPNCRKLNLSHTEAALPHGVNQTLNHGSTSDNHGNDDGSSNVPISQTRKHPYSSWDRDNPGNWTIKQLKDRLWTDLGIKAPDKNPSKLI